jgi:SAM-dependent methyltransferase
VRAASHGDRWGMTDLRVSASPPGSGNASPSDQPSKGLVRILAKIRSHSNAPILDAGCGYGRNAIALAARGFSVVCVDQKLQRLNALVDVPRRRIADLLEPGRQSGQLCPVLARLEASRWPFSENCFAGIICVHFLNVALLEAFRSSLVEGGYLYIETFGGHGGNYLDLPKAAQLHDLLWPDFHIPFYRERKVGPAGYDAVTVKLFALKRSYNSPATLLPHLWTTEAV